ncbi:MAG: manganese efflux pump MntP family protein [Lachnospiraceae bacterium]|nr:manganese efflux pump MntP family protein [Lachnospiraceae bacterium]
MEWGFLFFFNSIFLGVGLAMDAFSVSLANGLNEPRMKKGRMFLIAGVFGGFQALMPLAGWICVHTIVEIFGFFDKIVPWIALILLGFIGIKMIVDGVKPGTEEEVSRSLTIKALIVQGIATSIDALSVGFTIADYGPVMALVCATIIALVTMIICIGGLLIGKKAGTKLSDKAQIFGGIILIGIGLEIFISGMLK